MKNLAFIVRRPDHTRDAFREHYEDIHAPLAMETVMEGTIRYVRHHIRDVLHGDADFDVITAFEYRDVASAVALGERLQTAQGERILADERTFMDRDRNTFFPVAEKPVMGAEDREAGLSVAVCVKASPASAGWLDNYEANQIPRLLDAVSGAAWCVQNCALGPETAFDAVTQLHATEDAGLAEWAAAVEATGARVVVVSVSEHETDTPWN